MFEGRVSLHTHLLELHGPCTDWFSMYHFFFFFCFSFFSFILLFLLNTHFSLLNKLSAISTYEQCNVDHKTLRSSLTVTEASSSCPWLPPVTSLRRGLAQWGPGTPAVWRWPSPDFHFANFRQWSPRIPQTWMWSMAGSSLQPTVAVNPSLPPLHFLCLQYYRRILYHWATCKARGSFLPGS